MLHTDVIIAGVQLTFWTDHDADIETFEDIFPYHLCQQKGSIHPESFHDIIIASSEEAPDVPKINNIR